jgi:hypothetical protein
LDVATVEGLNPTSECLEVLLLHRHEVSREDCRFADVDLYPDGYRIELIER